MGTASCPNCGSQLSAKPGATRVTCSSCGKEYRIRASSASSQAGPHCATSGQDAALPPALWHAVLGGEKTGTHSFERMKSLIQEQRLKPDALVWRQGMEDWQTAGDVPQLRESFAQVRRTSEAPATESQPPPLPDVEPSKGSEETVADANDHTEHLIQAPWEIGGQIAKVAIRNQIAGHVETGEQLIVTIRGVLRDYLLVTNRKVVIIKEKWEGLRVKTYGYAHISSVDASKRLFFGKIEIAATGAIDERAGHHSSGTTESCVVWYARKYLDEVRQVAEEIVRRSPRCEEQLELPSLHKWLARSNLYRGVWAALGAWLVLLVVLFVWLALSDAYDAVRVLGSLIVVLSCLLLVPIAILVEILQKPGRNRWCLHCAESCRLAGKPVRALPYVRKLGRSGVDVDEARNVVVGLANLAEEQGYTTEAKELRKHVEELTGVGGLRRESSMLARLIGKIRRLTRW